MIKINPKRLDELPAAKHRRISYPGTDESLDGSAADIGHLCTRPTRQRFMVPLECLSRTLFIELLRITQEEYGLPSHGAITVPCDSTMFEYVVPLVGKWIPEELEKTLLTSIATCHQLASSQLISFFHNSVYYILVVGHVLICTFSMHIILSTKLWFC
ncbi:hypothetical protein Q3G72_027278 [Acer saccharum]|nr:hypothetical protein Q3G72_027278 [Acer saccharum]